MSGIAALKAKLAAGGGGGIPIGGMGGGGGGAAAAIARKKAAKKAAGETLESEKQEQPALSRPRTAKRRKRSAPNVDRDLILGVDESDDYSSGFSVSLVNGPASSPPSTATVLESKHEDDDPTDTQDSAAAVTEPSDLSDGPPSDEAAAATSEDSSAPTADDVHPAASPSPGIDEETRDQLNRDLAKREGLEDIQKQRIYKTPQQATAEELSKAMATDTVKKEISSRETIEELTEARIYKTPHQVKGEELARSMASDTVKKEITSRETIEELTEARIYKTPQQAAGEELERSMHAISLKKEMQKRPELDELADARIYKSIPKARQDELALAMATDSVKKDLTKRHDINEVQESGIYKTETKVRQEELARSMATDSVKKGIQKRSTVTEIEAKGIYKSETKVKQEELDRAMKTDALKKGIGMRTDMEELSKGGIIKSPRDVAAEKVDRSIRSSRVSKHLAERNSRIAGPSDKALLDPSDLDGMDGIEEEVSLLFERPSPLEEMQAYKDDYSEDIVKDRRYQLETRLSKDVRQDVEDLRAKGIIRFKGNEYTDMSDRMREDRESKARKKKARVSLLTHMRARPDPKFLIEQGIVKREYVHSGASGAQSKAEESEYVKKARRDLAAAVEAKLSKRPTQDELAETAYVPQTKSEIARRLETDFHPALDPAEVEEMRAKASVKPEDLKLDVDISEDKDAGTSKFAVAATADGAAKASEDERIVSELKQIAGRHHRFVSAVDELAGELPFSGDTAAIVAETMMQHMVDTNKDVTLCPNVDCDDPSHDHSLVMTEDRKRERRKSVSNLSSALKRRLSKSMLQDMAVMRREDASPALMPKIEDLTHKLRRQPSREAMEDRGLLRRQSISGTIQPAMVALEKSLKTMHDKRRASIEAAGLDATDSTVEPPALTKMKSLGGVSAHEIAPSLQQTAKLLHKKRLSHRLDLAMSARPTIEDLIDDGYLKLDPTISHSLQRTAVSLEEKLKYRVTEEYLKKKGVLPAKLDLDSAMQGLAGDLQQQLKRRPSLVDKDDFLQRVLKDIDIDAIPQTGDMDEWKPDDVRDGAAAIADVEEGPLVGNGLAEATYGMLRASYNAAEEFDSDDMDNLHSKKKHNTKRIERRLSLRPKLDQLTGTALIPYSMVDYASDPKTAHEIQTKIKRELIAEDMEWRMRSRMTPEEMVARGLTRVEYFTQDRDEAEREIARKKQGQRDQLASKLAALYNPVLDQLEKEGVVDEGWFEEQADAVASGHRKQDSVVNELQKKLLERPDYASIVAEGLLDDQMDPSGARIGSGARDSEDEEDLTAYGRSHTTPGGYNSDPGALGTGTRDPSGSAGSRSGMEDDEDEEGDREDGDNDSEFVSESTDESYDDEDDEQRIRLQQLERSIARRPSQADLTSMGYVIAEDRKMAPALHAGAHELEKKLKRRKSIDEVRGEGRLIDAVSSSRSKEISDTKATLSKRLARGRRMSHVDLENKGIVPEGYFQSATKAILTKSRRRQSIVHDLGSRLKSRPEYAAVAAQGLFEKAMKRQKEKEQLILEEVERVDKAAESAQASFAAKLAARPSPRELEDRGMVPLGFHDGKSADYLKSRQALERQQRKQQLEASFNARTDPETMVDSGYLREDPRSSKLDRSLVQNAASLEESLATRVPEKYLAKKGVLEKGVWDYNIDTGESEIAIRDKMMDRPTPEEMRMKGFHLESADEQRQEKLRKIAELTKNLEHRPDRAELQDRGLAPHGVFEDAQAAVRMKEARRESITAELNAVLPARPTYDDLVKAGVIRMGEDLTFTPVVTRKNTSDSSPGNRTPMEPMYDETPMEEAGRRDSYDMEEFEDEILECNDLPSSRPTVTPFNSLTSHSVVMGKGQNGGRGASGSIPKVYAGGSAFRKSVASFDNDFVEFVAQAEVGDGPSVGTSGGSGNAGGSGQSGSSAQGTGGGSSSGGIGGSGGAADDDSDDDSDNGRPAILNAAVGGPIVHSNPFESILSVDALVPEPELSVKTIKSSPLAFLNVLDNIRDLNLLKMEEASECMNDMKRVSNELKHVKNIYRNLAVDGYDSMEGVPEFALWLANDKTGDVQADLESVEARMKDIQDELFRIDDRYQPVHESLRMLGSIEFGLQKFEKKYTSNMSQLRRVLLRINEVLTEHKIQKETADAALEATEMQQKRMVEKITDKINETKGKMEEIGGRIIDEKQRILNERSLVTIFMSDYVVGGIGAVGSAAVGLVSGSADDSSAAVVPGDVMSDQAMVEGEVDSVEILDVFVPLPTLPAWDEDTMEISAELKELLEEWDICQHFITGLNEFLIGLRRLRNEQKNRIEHLDAVIEVLTVQRSEIQGKMEAEESQAINMLAKIRAKYIAPMQAQLLLNSGYTGRRMPESSPAGVSATPDDGEDQKLIEPDYEEPVKAMLGSEPLSLSELKRRREKRMSKVYAKMKDLEARAMTTSSSDYLRGLTEIRQLQTVMDDAKLKYFFTHFVSKCNQIFHDIQLASMAVFMEKSAELKSAVLQDLSGVAMMNEVIRRHKLKPKKAEQYLDCIQRVIERLPDREVVIMQVARHLASNNEYSEFVTGESWLNMDESSDVSATVPSSDSTTSSSTKSRYELCKAYLHREDFDTLVLQPSEINIYAVIDACINKLVYLWMASMLDAFGDTSLTSFRVSLEDDVIAQVRPNKAAALVLNCCYGIDVTGV